MKRFYMFYLSRKVRFSRNNCHHNNKQKWEKIHIFCSKVFPRGQPIWDFCCCNGFITEYSNKFLFKKRELLIKYLLKFEALGLISQKDPYDMGQLEWRSRRHYVNWHSNTKFIAYGPYDMVYPVASVIPVEFLCFDSTFKGFMTNLLSNTI